MFRENYNQTDGQKERPANTRSNIDKVRPANTAKLSTINRQDSHNEEVGKIQPVNTMQLSTVRRNFRLNSPCTHSAIDNARQANGVMLNATLIAQSRNSQLFRD